MPMVRSRGGMVLALTALLVAALPASAGRSAAAEPLSCAALAAAEPQNGHYMPPVAPALFAADFPHLTDCEWGYRLGGWGGLHKHAAREHVPVIFVHGNQSDAENWFQVADQFSQLAGYTDQEMYAISYNGLENASAGKPLNSGPSPRSTAYWQAYPDALTNGGKGASDDPNVLDLYNFIHAVQAYTGSTEVDLVAHSLGVTLVRKTMFLHHELYHQVLAVVGIAGANHGTSVCRGLAGSYYGCDEIAPDTPWLAELNSIGEAPGPTRWMSIYNGTDNADPFFVTGGAFDDRQSPHLEGAINRTFPNTYHNDLRVDPEIVPIYLRFLLRHGQPVTSPPPSPRPSPAPPVSPAPGAGGVRPAPVIPPAGVRGLPGTSTGF